MFIVGRTIAGIGGSGISTGALTIISAILPPRAQARFLGLNMGLGQLGLALGPIVGGAFTQYVSWRWCTYHLPRHAFSTCRGEYLRGHSLILFRFLHQSSHRRRRWCPSLIFSHSRAGIKTSGARSPRHCDQIPRSSRIHAHQSSSCHVLVGLAVRWQSVCVE